MEASEPIQRQITSAALSSDSRIIEVIRPGLVRGERPALRRPGGQQVGGEPAFTVDSVFVTSSDRASPTRSRSAGPAA